MTRVPTTKRVVPLDCKIEFSDYLKMLKDCANRGLDIISSSHGSTLLDAVHELQDKVKQDVDAEQWDFAYYHLFRFSVIFIQAVRGSEAFKQLRKEARDSLTKFADSALRHCTAMGEPGSRLHEVYLSEMRRLDGELTERQRKRYEELRGYLQKVFVAEEAGRRRLLTEEERERRSLQAYHEHYRPLDVTVDEQGDLLKMDGTGQDETHTSNLDVLLRECEQYTPEGGVDSGETSDGLEAFFKPVSPASPAAPPTPPAPAPGHRDPLAGLLAPDKPRESATSLLGPESPPSSSSPPQPQSVYPPPSPASDLAARLAQLRSAAHPRKSLLETAESAERKSEAFLKLLEEDKKNRDEICGVESTALMTLLDKERSTAEERVRQQQQREDEARQQQETLRKKGEMQAAEQRRLQQAVQDLRRIEKVIDELRGRASRLQETLKRFAAALARNQPLTHASEQALEGVLQRVSGGEADEIMAKLHEVLSQLEKHAVAASIPSFQEAVAFQVREVQTGLETIASVRKLAEDVRRDSSALNEIRKLERELAELRLQEHQAPRSPQRTAGERPDARLAHMQHVFDEERKRQMCKGQLRTECLRDWNYVSSNPSQSRRGLVNLGNTCYMNSVLQALNGTCFVDMFLNYSFESLINIHNPMGQKGQFANTFGAVVQEMSQRAHFPVSPSGLKHAVGSRNETFSGISQQDANEFLQTLLGGLHEDLNGARRGRSRPLPDLPTHGVGDQEIANRALAAYRQNNDSKVDTLFGFQERSTLICPACHHRSVTFQSQQTLSVPIVTSINQCTLADCLMAYTDAENLPRGSEWKCEKCQREVQATKQLSLWSLPRILVVTLKRFCSTQNFLDKIRSEVYFPASIDLSDLVVGPDRSRSRYSLAAVVNHDGGLGGGHYTADVRGRLDKQWFRFSDERVTPSSGRPSYNQAYMLIYVSE